MDMQAPTYAVLHYHRVRLRYTQRAHPDDHDKHDNNTVPAAPHLELLLQALVVGCGSRLELLHNLDLLQGRKGAHGIP